MRKIKTIFDRNWETNRKVNERIVVDFDFGNAIATEKLDGTNVRVTVRNELVVRLEKRRNPLKIQKKRGITEPWYVDADEFNSEDKWIYEALKNTDFTNVHDGEWSAEAIRLNIQGNPLNFENNQLFLFSIPSWREKIVLKDVPFQYDEIKDYLKTQKSLIGNDCLIEGIVWHHPNCEMVKIKRKDFIY